MAWMYILRCKDESFYTGSTTLDLDARVWQHNHDDDWAANYTRTRRPVVVVYAEEFDRIDDAFAREKQVQGWSRVKKMALIERRGADLPDLARSRASDASTSSATEACKPVPEPVEGPGARGLRASDASTSSATESTSSATESTSSATEVRA